MRFFNTAGPVNCQKHYCLDPLQRIQLEEILSLIEQEKYFVLHAPRQTGKTTCLLALMDYLNREGRYACVYANVESAQAARENVEQGITDILRELGSRAQIHLTASFPQEIFPEVMDRRGYGTALNQCLTRWSGQSDLPLVILLDEVDSLVGDTLISVLRQIRSGYDKRPRHFPQSIILCGVRDVRDYRIHSAKDKTVITGGSAFNIKAESLRLGDFSYVETKTLYQQHTGETGQVFEPEALNLAWELTRGQPWLANALAYEVCFRMKEGKDRHRSITVEMMQQAKENLILRRETHLDQLTDKLQEERVQNVIGPLIQGVDMSVSLPEDDIQYVTDLGLIRRKPQVEIANPIYREIIPRMLTATTQDMLAQETLWYVKPDGRLSMEKLLSAFQVFFREHSEHWVERFQYKEAGPQLLMQAFLQRIVNSGGRIEREYGLGKMRTDLLVIWNVRRTEDGGRRTGNGRQKTEDEGRKSEIQKAVIELKVLHKSLEQTLRTGLKQTWEYMDRCGATEGHLVLFDRDSKRSWEEKIFKCEETYEGHAIRVWGM